MESINCALVHIQGLKLLNWRTSHVPLQILHFVKVTNKSDTASQE